MSKEGSVRNTIILAAALATITATLLAYLSYRHDVCTNLRTKAFGAFNQHYWQFASRQCEDYIDCDPKDQQVLRMCIESNFQNNDFPQARYWIDRTRATIPNDPAPDYWQGVLLIVEKDDFAKALPLLTSVRFAVEDQYPKVNLFLALALFDAGESDAACDSLDYYLRTPREDNNQFRQKADDLYRLKCKSRTLNP